MRNFIKLINQKFNKLLFTSRFFFALALFLFFNSYAVGHIAASITFDNVSADNSVSASTPTWSNSNTTFTATDVWVNRTSIDSYSFDSSCLTMTGALSWTYTYGNGASNTLTATMPASWITASTLDAVTFSRPGRGGDNVRAITFTTNTLKVVNSCSTAKSFSIVKTLDFGENHWDVTISSGTNAIPAANVCTVSLPDGNTMDLGSISAADINENYNNLLSNYEATTTMQVSCTTATTYLLSFSSSNGTDSSGCLEDSATDHNLSFCLSANSNALNFSSSSTPSITLTGSEQQNVSLTVTPRSLTNNALAGTYSSTVTVTVTAE